MRYVKVVDMQVIATITFYLPNATTIYNVIFNICAVRRCEAKRGGEEAAGKGQKKYANPRFVQRRSLTPFRRSNAISHTRQRSRNAPLFFYKR